MYVNLDEIPLPPDEAPHKNDEDDYSPATPPTTPPYLFDTVDSFDILDQTIYKQKRLARAKKSPDMRLKVLLKCTFDLVCEIMDRENDTLSDSDEDDDVELELSPERDRKMCARLDLETCKQTDSPSSTALFAASQSDEGSATQVEPSQENLIDNESIQTKPARKRRFSRFCDEPTVQDSSVFATPLPSLASVVHENETDKSENDRNETSTTSSPPTTLTTNQRLLSDLAESEFEYIKAPASTTYTITVQVDEKFFQRSFEQQFADGDHDRSMMIDDEVVRIRPATYKRRRSDDYDDDHDSEDDDKERYAVEITRMSTNVLDSPRQSCDKKRRVY